jgi:hypothetical protein
MRRFLRLTCHSAASHKPLICISATLPLRRHPPNEPSPSTIILLPCPASSPHSLLGLCSHPHPVALVIRPPPKDHPRGGYFAMVGGGSLVLAKVPRRGFVPWIFLSLQPNVVAGDSLKAW